MRNRPRLTSASSALTRALSVSIISASPFPGNTRHADASRTLQFVTYVQGIGRGVNRLQPGAYQHQVGRTGRQQRDGQRDMHAFAGGLQGHLHGPQNIRRFYPGSLARYFSGDSGLVYNSGTPSEMVRSSSQSSSFPAGRPELPRGRAQIPGRAGASSGAIAERIYDVIVRHRNRRVEPRFIRPDSASIGRRRHRQRGLIPVRPRKPACDAGP